MGVIFLHTLNRMRGTMLGWGLSLAGVAILFMTFFEDIATQADTLKRLMQSYPPEVLALFGAIQDLSTPQGFLGMYFFSSMPLILGIFAVLAGSGLLLQDEEEGVLDLLLAHPIDRAQLFLGRLLGMMVVTAGILAIAFAGIALSTQWAGIDTAIVELAKSFITLYVQLFFLSAFSLMLSLLMPGRSTAAMTSGLLLFVAYFINSLSSEVESLRQAARFTPMHYYQGAQAIGEPLDWGSLLGLLGLGLVFLAVAWWRWRARDIRITGEGAWSWRGLLVRSRGSSA